MAALEAAIQSLCGLRTLAGWMAGSTPDDVTVSSMKLSCRGKCLCLEQIRSQGERSCRVSFVDEFAYVRIGAGPKNSDSEIPAHIFGLMPRSHVPKDLLQRCLVFRKHYPSLFHSISEQAIDILLHGSSVDGVVCARRGEGCTLKRGKGLFVIRVSWDVSGRRPGRYGRSGERKGEQTKCT